MPPEVHAVLATLENVAGYCVLMTKNLDTARNRDERPDAQVSIEIIDAGPASSSFGASRMERHSYSVQAFIPMTGCDYLAVVCHTNDQDHPDLSDLRALIVPGNTVMQYVPGVWHLPIRTVSRSGRFCVVINKAGTPQDCEWAETDPFTVIMPTAHPDP